MSILHSILSIVPDKMYIQLMYYKHFKKFANLKEPKTFNEKLQWLKLNDRKEIYTTMVDKIEAKKYVAKIIGDEYIIPTLGVWDNPADIDFDSLPEKFVLKWNHDSGSVIICKDKKSFNKKEAIKKLEKYKKHNGFLYGREWPYKNVKPKILAEKYMCKDNDESLNDFKFFCFNGNVKCFKVDFGRFTEHHANYYDLNNNLLSFGEKSCNPQMDKKINLPESIEIMKKKAEELSKKHIFLRVDFYDVGGKVYFGELTFYPASGFGRFTSDEWDVKMGNWLKLPKV